MPLFPQQTTLYFRLTRHQVKGTVLLKTAIPVTETEEMVNMANRRGISYSSDWRGCVSVIPQIITKNNKYKRRYYVSITEWECEVPF
jgi:hypothetical protein